MSEGAKTRVDNHISLQVSIVFVLCYFVGLFPFFAFLFGSAMGTSTLGRWSLCCAILRQVFDSSLRECLLQEKWKTHQGRDHNLNGWRAARHQPTAPARAVLAALGLDKGTGKGGRRRPKREADRAEASTASRQRRT